ncbi:MAG: hypothetical protein SFX18_11695 [Pirellulales bacterium]|nr:hypothetical protein [Pirellulales bacterium]
MPRMAKLGPHLGWMTLALLAGCQGGPRTPMPPLNPPQVGIGPAVPYYSPPKPFTATGWQSLPVVTNPIQAPVADRDFAWDQIVDVVDDYFKIEREERVRQTGEILTEGRIDTYPQTAATIFEPWRSDGVTLSDRWLSTLQSYRRRASVRVIPDIQGFQIEVVVQRELEDLPRPAHATAGAATLRHDTSPDRRTEAEPVLGRAVGDDARPVANPPPTLGWIPAGRDEPLEQEMLLRIAERLNVTTDAIRAGRLTPHTAGPVFAAPAVDTTPGLIGPNGPTSASGLPPDGAHIGLPPEGR